MQLKSKFARSNEEFKKINIEVFEVRLKYGIPRLSLTKNSSHVVSTDITRWRGQETLYINCGKDY